MSLKGIAKETLKIVEEGKYISPFGKIVQIDQEQKSAVDGTILYTPMEAIKLFEVHKAFGNNVKDNSLLLTIGDNNRDVATSLSNAFSGVDQVEVVEGDLLQLSCDAIVSPANSFGDMGGGIDKSIDEFHKRLAQPAIMTAIKKLKRNSFLTHSTPFNPIPCK